MDGTQADRSTTPREDGPPGMAMAKCAPGLDPKNALDGLRGVVDDPGPRYPILNNLVTHSAVDGVFWQPPSYVSLQTHWSLDGDESTPC